MTRRFRTMKTKYDVGETVLVPCMVKAIDINKNGVLSIEEKAYLETLSTQELLKLVDDTNKAKGGKQ